MELDEDEERAALIFADHLSEIFDHSLVASRIVFLFFSAAAELDDDGSSLRMVQQVFDILLFVAVVLDVVNAVDPLPEEPVVGMERTHEKARHRHRRFRVSGSDMIMHGMAEKFPAFVLRGVDPRQFLREAPIRHQPFRLVIRLGTREARTHLEDLLCQLEGSVVCIVEVHFIQGIEEIGITLLFASLEIVDELFARDLAQPAHGDVLRAA